MAPVPYRGTVRHLQGYCKALPLTQVKADILGLILTCAQVLSSVRCLAFISAEFPKILSEGLEEDADENPVSPRPRLGACFVADLQKADILGLIHILAPTLTLPSIAPSPTSPFHPTLHPSLPHLPPSLDEL